MTDKPWEKLPPALEPSRIITPSDTITVTVNNRGPVPQATMQCSRELPRAYVIGIFAALINQLSAEMMRAQFQQVIPATEPGTEPRGNGGKS